VFPWVADPAGIGSDFGQHGTLVSVAEVRERRYEAMTYTGIMNGLLIVGGSVIASLILVAYVRKLFSEETLRNSSDLIGNVLSIVGTFYAILLGLIVVDSLTQFEGSIDTVQAESNCVADIFMLSERLPDPYGSHVRDLCGCMSIKSLTTNG